MGYDIRWWKLDILLRIRHRNFSLPEDARPGNALLDAGVSATHDGPVHRAARRSINDGLPIDVEIADAFTIVAAVPSDVPRRILERLVDIADAAGAAAMIDAVADAADGTEALGDLGFEIVAGD